MLYNIPCYIHSFQIFVEGRKTFEVKLKLALNFIWCITATHQWSLDLIISWLINMSSGMAICNTCFVIGFPWWKRGRKRNRVSDVFIAAFSLRLHTSAGVPPPHLPLKVCFTSKTLQSVDPMSTASHRMQKCGDVVL